MEDLPANDPRVLQSSKAVPVWFVPEQGRIQDDLLAFFEMQQIGCEINQLVLPVRAGPGDSRMPPLTTVVDHWIPWDETITEEMSIHWLIPDATLFATMCDHIADDAVDLRPDGTDPRDAEQVKLYIHHLPVTDLTYVFSQLHQEDTTVDHIFMNLRAETDAEPGTSSGDRLDTESVTSEALNIPLPENIDNLFGDDSIVDFSFGGSVAGSAGESVGLASHDSYYDPDIEEETEQTPVDLGSLTALIDDKCLGVPPTMAVKLPWEIGVFEQIFDETEGLPPVPIPRMAPVEVVVDAPKPPSCFDPRSKQGGGRGVYLRVINFDLNISDAELDQKAWSTALEKWYASGRPAWPRGYDLDEAIDSHEVMGLRKVFGNRSANTVETLERALLDETIEVTDRYAAGALLFCLYSRSRLSDLKKVRGFCKDITENHGAIAGYLEFRTRSHKTARLVSKQGLAMPLIAPVWGLLSPPWGLTFLRVAQMANIDFEHLADDPLLPAPEACEEVSWQHRAVTTTEAGKWLRSLLSRQLGEIDFTTIHSLKATPLSWCAKAGLSPHTRLLLGHHTTDKQSADTYARDVLAAPLREFESVLQQIRSGALIPDATRSGMVGEATRMDPKDVYTAPVEEEENESISSSSSESESSSDESVDNLLLPDDPVAEKAQWDPDFEMYQHAKSKIVHLRAVGTQQPSFSCGVKMTPGFERVEAVNFLQFRKCKRCTTAKPVKDVGAMAAAFKKRRLESESNQ
eukprot:s1104_g37.t2